MSKITIILRYLSSKIKAFAKSYEMDDKYWSLALAEFESDSKNKDLWAKCLAKSNFDEGKAKSLYMKIRAKELSEIDLPSDVQVKEYIKSGTATTRYGAKTFFEYLKNPPLLHFSNHYVQKISYTVTSFLLWVLLFSSIFSKDSFFGDSFAFFFANVIVIYVMTTNVKRNVISLSCFVFLVSIHQYFSYYQNFTHSLGYCFGLGWIGYFIFSLLRGRLFDDKYVPSDVFSKYVIGVAIAFTFAIPMAISDKENRLIEKEINAEYAHIFGELYGLCSVNQYVTKKYCEPTSEDEKFTSFCNADIVPKVLPSSMISEARKLVESGNMNRDIVLLIDRFDAKYALEKMNNNDDDVCPQLRSNLRGMFDKSLNDLSNLKDKRYKLLKRLD
jgi:hypothetical protein